MKKTAFFLLLMFSLLISYEVLANADSEYEKALHYYNQGKYKEAAVLLKEYVRNKPDAVAYYRAGYALYKIKKFDEANEYFKQAYLLDPSFSPQIVGPAKEQPMKQPPKVRKSKPKPALTQTEPSGLPPETPVEQKQQEAPAEPELQKQPPAEGQPQPIVKKPSGSIAPRQEQPLSEPPKVDPGKGIKASPIVPTFPKTQKPVLFPGSIMLTGLFAGFATLIIILGIAFYIYFCLCIFLIAKKLDVPNPWLAWIPIVQIWTVVNCAGKPWWWLLLLLVPIVSFIVSIMLWMSISENLGRNKWLGLLMLLPIVNFVYIGVLAFSKGEKPVPMPEDATPA